MNDLIPALQALFTAGLTREECWAVLPPNYTLTDLERFQTAPNALRGHFTTTDVAAFVGYVNDHGDGATVVFIDADHGTAHARLDHGTPDNPEWGRHQATLTLAPTPCYRALLALHDTRQPATGLVDWLLDWAPHIEAFSDPEPPQSGPDLSVGAAVQALRKLKVESGTLAEHTEAALGHSRSVLDRAQITSAPPVWLRVTCVPYDPLPARDFLVRLAYLPSDPPQVSARCAALTQAKHAIAHEMARVLADQLDASRIYLGAFK